MFIQFVSEKLSKQSEQAGIRDDERHAGSAGDALHCPMSNKRVAKEVCRWRWNGDAFPRCLFFFFFGDKCCQLWMDERRLIVRLVSRLLHWQTALLTHSRARVETLKFEKRDNTQTKPNRTNATAQLTAGCVSPKTKTKNKNKKLESAKRNNDPNVSLLRVLVTVPMTSCCTLALAFSQNWVNWSWYFLTSIYCSYWF